MEAGKKRIWIRGQYVEVTDEVYMAYTQGDRKMRYFENDLKTERFVLGPDGTSHPQPRRFFRPADG